MVTAGSTRLIDLVECQPVREIHGLECIIALDRYTLIQVFHFNREKGEVFDGKSKSVGKIRADR